MKKELKPTKGDLLAAKVIAGTYRKLLLEAFGVPDELDTFEREVQAVARIIAKSRREANEKR